MSTNTFQRRLSFTEPSFPSPSFEAGVTVMNAIAASLHRFQLADDIHYMGNQLLIFTAFKFGCRSYASPRFI